MDNTGEQGQRLGEMPQAEMGQAGGAAADPAAEQGARRLVEVIDLAVEELGGEQREAVRQGVLDMVGDTLHELVEQERRRIGAAGGNGAGGGNGAMVIGDAAQAGIAAARQLQDLGFVQFTSGLVDGVFNTIIASTVKQMDAYSKMVADVSKSLAQFQAENVPPARVTAHLAERYPDGQGGTLVRPAYEIPDTPADTVNGIPAKTGNQKLQEIVGTLILETENLPRDDRLTRTSIGIPVTDNAVKQFTETQVSTIRTALAKALATSMIEHLRQMVREGMARIVVTNGKILTKLTFNVTATEEDRTRNTNYHRDSAGAYIKGAAWAGWGVVQAGGNWNQLNVRQTNDSTFDSLTMSAEMIGQVEINFKTETFAAQTN